LPQFATSQGLKALGKLVQIQRCPRNGKKWKACLYKSSGFTPLHQYVGRWI